MKKNYNKIFKFRIILLNFYLTVLILVILSFSLSAQVAVVSGGVGAPAGTGVNGYNNAGGDATGLGCGGGGGSWWGGSGGAGKFGGGGAGAGGYFSLGSINWAGGDGGQGVVAIAFYNGVTFLNSVVLTSGNSYTVGAGITSAKVWAIGGGGGGGGATSNDGTAAGGGGAGGVAYVTKSVSQGSTITYTLGSGGLAGHGATISAVSGGSTSVTIAGTTIVGNGGGPGLHNNTSTASGGTYSGGDGGANGGTGAGSSGDDGGGGGGAIGGANGTQNGNDGGTGANSVDVSGLFAACSTATIQETPTISSFTPTSGLTGTTVTITGTNLSGATSVKFGGVNASTFTVNSSTEIVATVAATSVTGSVSVTLPFATVSKPIYFFTAPSPPTMSSFTPSSATTGGLVTISGNNFLGVTSVSFGGTPALSFTINSNFEIKATVATGTTGNVSVTSSAGTASLAGFTYTAPPTPTVSSFTPTSASTGQTVNISGTNFSGATAVSFGGTAASSFTVNSATSISAVVGTGTSGSVSVTTSAGTSNLTGFSFVDPVQASSITFSNIQETQMTIGWTNGNGTKRAVFAKEGTGTASPSNNTTYAASSAFGSGTQIGSSGWFCVYNSTGNSVTIIGLVLGTQYTVQVFEYNGNALAEKYNVSTATDNPMSQNTSGSTLPANLTSVTTNNNILCSGTSTTLTANGVDGTVYWYTGSCGGTATSPTTGNTLTVTPTATTTYYARNYKNSQFSADCASITLTVNPIPADQTVTASPTSICSGNSATITVGSSEVGVNYTLRDNSNNTVIAGPKAGTGGSITFNIGALLTNKTYNVLAETLRNSTALSADGVDEYVSTANVVMSNTWTYETMVKPNDISSIDWSGIITSNSGNGSGMWFQFSLNGSGSIRWESSDPWLSVDGIGPVINDNSWHHVAVSCDGTNIRFYTDGVLRRTESYTGGSMNRPLHIMAERQPNQYIRGLVDQTMVWNYARSLSEIQSDGTTTLTGTEPGLVLYYTYENGSGTTVTDIAGGDHNGAMMNMENDDWIVNGNPAFTNYNCPIQLSSTATVSVSTANTLSLSSAVGTDSQNVCINNAITEITYTTTGATGIGSATNLPAGLSANWANNTISISGTPTASGTFNYSIPLTGGCGSVSATGTIIVYPATVGGSISGGTSVCAGTNSTVLTISGHIGNVIKWQSSTDNWNTSEDISNASATLTATNLTANTKYRAVVSSGTCTEANTTDTEITMSIVDQTVTATSPICTGSSSTITLGSSQSGVNYTLRDNSSNAIIEGPTAGTGAELTFNTGALTSGKTYNVLAEKTTTVSKMALAFTGNAGLKKVSLGTTLWTNNFQGTNKATVEAWVYRTTTGSLHTIVSNYEGSFPFLFRIDNDQIAFFINSNFMVRGATTLAINTWYHVAGTYDGTNVKVYVNGVLDGTDAYSGNFISTTTEMKIGGGLSNNTEYFPGSISDVRLWNVARTAAEISSSYNVELNGNESGLVALYKLDEGAGSTVGNSATGNLYPGTLVNSPAWIAGPSITSGSCSSQMATTPTVIVTPNNTTSAASSNPTLCINTPLTSITHTTTGATGIGSATNLPAGVTASWASNKITINGTPSESGIFNYSIPLTGGCENVNATGTITVNSEPEAPTAGSNSYTYSGTVKTATASVGIGETVDWYAAATGNTTSSAPTGTNVGTYSAYAEARNITTGCVSASRTLITLEIIKSTLTVTADDQTKVYGAVNPILTFQYSGWVNGVETIDTPPTISTTVAGTSVVGTYTNSITLSGGTDNNYTFNLVAGDFEVTKAVLTATADDQTKAYGDANPVLTFQYSGWVNGVETIDTPPTISTTVTGTSVVGTYTNATTLSGGTDNNYTFSLVAGDFEVTKAVLTAKADNQTKVYGAANPVLTFQYSGWVNGVETIDTPPTISTTVAGISVVGIYSNSITLSGGTNNNYNFNLVNGDFEVTKAVLTATADDQTKVYGDANPTLTFQYSGWVNGVEPINTPPMISTTVSETSVVGTYNNAITISGGVDNNYAFSYEAANFTVTKATLKVTADAQTKIYGDANPTLTFQYSGWKNSDIETVLDTQPVATTTVDLLTYVGTHSNAINISGGVDNNYAFNYVAANFTVTKATLTATADAKMKIYGDANPTLTFQYSGWKNSDNETVLDIKPTATANFDLMTSVGIYTNAINVSGGNDNNYDFIYIPANFKVTKAMLTVTADSMTKEYSETNPPLTFQYSGWKNGDDAADLTTAPNASTKVTVASPVDVYIDAINVAGGTDENYDFTYIPANFTVTQAMLIVTAEAKTKIYGEANPALTFKYSGWKNSDDETVLDTRPTAKTSVELTSSAGIYTNAITMSEGADNNYNFTYVAADFEVTKALLTIEAKAQNKDYDGTNIASVTGAKLVGVINGDIVSLHLGSAYFENKNLGNDKVITVSGSSISGADAGNYTLAEVFRLKANITPKQLTITNTSVVTNKMIDNSTSAVVENVGTLNGLATDDVNSVKVSAIANYNDAAVGTGKVITIVFTISGSAASNYLKPVNLIITGAKISDIVNLSENLEVPVNGECQGEDLFIGYQILKGTPSDYKITFNAVALAAGFVNTGYLPLTSTQSRDRIYIHVPANMVEGAYSANLQFQNELNVESPVYSFQFSIKLSKNYIVKKFDDVILCDNSSNRFTAYQWYKNGQLIQGATSQFYNDKSGLDGFYSVHVSTKGGAILWSCEKEIHTPKFKNAIISAYPNPARSSEPFTVNVTNLNDQDLKGAVMRIYNVLGALVQTIPEVKQVNSVKLPFGEYIGMVITSDQRRFTYKITVVNFKK